MKIRAGFVSNSSSSSFVLIIKKDAYSEWRSQSDPIVQAAADAVMESYNIFGNECMLYEYASNDYWFDHISIDEIVKKAKEMAKEQNVGIATKIAQLNNVREEDINDEWLYDNASEILYSIKYSFGDYIKDGKAWSHSIDW